MKTVLHTRLIQRQFDYGFYIAPDWFSKPLARAIADDFLNAKKSYLFIYANNNGIIFGKKNTLEIKDNGNRPRKTFYGQQILWDEVKTSLPYLSGIEDKFTEIYEESTKLNIALDNNENEQELSKRILKFEKGDYNPAKDWDKVIKNLRKKPFKQDILFMFSDTGNALEIDPNILEEFGISHKDKSQKPPQQKTKAKTERYKKGEASTSSKGKISEFFDDAANFFNSVKKSIFGDHHDQYQPEYVYVQKEQEIDENDKSEEILDPNSPQFWETDNIDDSNIIDDAPPPNFKSNPLLGNQYTPDI